MSKAGTEIVHSAIGYGATGEDFVPVTAAAPLPVTLAAGVAHDVADAGNPVKVGGYAADIAPTPVATGDRVNAWLGRAGNLAVGGIVIVPTEGAFNGVIRLPDLDNGIGRPLEVAPVARNASDTLDQIRGDTNGLAVQSALSAKFWSYAAATGGIVNSATAVTLKAAAGAGVRNYLKTLQLDHDVLGAATEIAVRDGAGGTVLWRGRLQTAALEGNSIVFDPPLKGTANMLMEVVTLTAVTGGVFVNAQGYTGA